jgi:archaellum component FlaF (FlaF/FlaG flagellin family)
MLILSILSTATGIGSIFVYADEHDHIYGVTADSNGDGTHTYHCEVDGCDEEKTESCSFGDDGICPVCGYEKEEGSDESSDHVHSFGDWIYDGTDYHYRECECGERETESCTYDSYLTNYNGTHLKRCTTCGNSVDESCTFSDPVVSEDGTTVTVTCIYCGYSETSENTDYVPAEDVEEEKTILNDTSEADEGSVYQFDDFFSSDARIAAATSLKYNFKEQELLVNAVDSVSADTLPGVTTVSGITYAAKYSGSPSGQLGHTGTDAGLYTVTCSLTYTYKDPEAAEGTQEAEEKTYSCSRSIDVEIAPVYVDDITIKPEETNLILIPKEYDKDPLCKLYVGENVIPEEAYTLEEPTGSTRPFKAGETITYLIDSKEKNPNFSFHIERTVNVNPVDLTFNGDTELKPAYRGGVEIAPPSGYTIGWNKDSCSLEKIKYTTLGTHDLTVFVRNTETEKVMSQDFQLYITEEEIVDDFIKSYPEFEEQVVLTGSTVDLMKTAPLLNTEYIEEKNYYDVSYGFVNSATGAPTYGKSPQGTDKGVYNFEFIIVVVKKSGDDPIVMNTGHSYSAKVLKSLTHSDINFTAQAADYQSLEPSIPTEDFYLVKDKDAILQKDTHYTASVDKEEPYYETGSEITITYTGLADAAGAHGAYYVEETQQTVKVSPVTVLFNGEEQKEKYEDAVTFTAEGYTISDAPDGTFNTEFVYSTSCSNLTVPLYFKKDGTSRIVMQNIEKLNIGKAADIVVLYDGDSELKPFYYDSVRISAKGFDVAPDDGKENFKGAYPLDYDENKNMQPVDDFVLIFRDKETGLDYKKTISGVNLYETPEIDILYNGEELKDWYNDDVIITAEGYTVSDEADAGFGKSYKMTGEGTVSKKLYFKDAKGVVETMVVVSIDRTGPTGSVSLEKNTSDSFMTKDSVLAYYNTTKSGTVTSSDDLSGVDYVQYYVSDTFYASEEEVTTAITEKSGKWRSYSKNSRPALVKNKSNYFYVLIHDKAGNVAAISLGNIVCDTIAPRLTTAEIVAGKEEGVTTVAVAGKDTQSGVNRFKFIYREKKEGKNDAPTKMEIFENGEYVAAQTQAEQIAAASYDLKGLDPEKTYLFYLIAVDRAGNISEVKTEEVEGASVIPATEEEEEGTSGGSGGLAPAPSGIAGSGTSEGGSGSSGQGGQGGAGQEGQGGSGSSGTGSSGTSGGSSQESGGSEINRDPYIADATGSTRIGEIETSGWNRISSEVKKADNGALIEVEMSGMPNVSGQLFESMKDKDVQVNLRMAGDLEWQIKGSDVSSAVGDRDMGVRIGSRNIPAQVIDEVAGSYPHVEFSGNHQGDLGFEATIAVPVGETNKGMVATLYSYDPDTKEMVASGNITVDEKGYARFPVTKSGDCTVVITPEGMLTAADQMNGVSGVLTAEDEDEYLTQESSKIRLTDIFALRGSARAWLFIVAFLSAAICLLILFLPALQLPNSDDMGDYL